MKRLLGLVTVIMVLTVVYTNSDAAVYRFYDKYDTDYYFDVAGPGRDTSLEIPFAFPDGGLISHYLTGDDPYRFEFDDEEIIIDSFKITLTGDSNNSSDAIDIFFNLAGHPIYDYQWPSNPVISCQYVPYMSPFTITLDFCAEDRLKVYYDHNYQQVRYDIHYDWKNNFANIDYFEVGYGCHFWERSTEVEIIAETAPIAIPEPSTIILMCAGIAGLIKRRFSSSRNK